MKRTSLKWVLVALVLLGIARSTFSQATVNGQTPEPPPPVTCTEELGKLYVQFVDQIQRSAQLQQNLSKQIADLTKERDDLKKQLAAVPKEPAK